MENEEFVKKMYMSESVGPSSRGKPPGRLRNRVKEDMYERGATRGEGWIKGEGSVWTGRGGDFSAMGDVPGGSEASEL